MYLLGLGFFVDVMMMMCVCVCIYKHVKYCMRRPGGILFYLPSIYTYLII